MGSKQERFLAWLETNARCMAWASIALLSAWKDTMRYCNQREKYSCGPVAILNALKWAGLKKTYKDVKEIEKGCPPDDYRIGGINPNNFTRLFYKYGEHLIIRYRKNINIGELDKHLEMGHAAVINLRRFNFNRGWEGHYFLVIGKSELAKCFKVVNGYGKPATIWMSRKEFIKHLRSSRICSPNGFRAWFLKRRLSG